MDGFAEKWEGLGSGFDEQKILLGLLNRAAPAVDRHDLRNNIDAGCQAVIQERMCDFLCFFERRGGAEDEPLVRHIESWRKSGASNLLIFAVGRHLLSVKSSQLARLRVHNMQGVVAEGSGSCRLAHIPAKRRLDGTVVANASARD